MSNTQHTPGPWEFVDNALVGPKIDDKPIWLRPVILRSETGVNEANARLIAAAPELLQAAKDFVEWFECGRIGDRPKAELHYARAVIAKATGGKV